MISICSCNHEFQDKRYGKFKRVFNKKAGSTIHRCTVCEKEKNCEYKKNTQKE